MDTLFSVKVFENKRKSGDGYTESCIQWERRLLSLRDLAARSVDAKSEQEAWAFAAQALSTNPYDISCAVPYKLDEHSAKATAVSHVGVRRDDPFFLEQVELDSSKPEGLAPALHKAVITGRAVELNAENGFRLSLPGGFWGVSPSELTILPVAQTGRDKAIGALAVGVNCHRGLDDDCAPAAEVGEHVAGLLED
jgi:hypothetical protein